MSAIAYVAFGSNLGAREDSLERARRLLVDDPGVVSLRLSRWMEPEPVGTVAAPATGGKYLNAVAELDTRLSALELLRLCLNCEAQLGRVRGVRNAPRPIDLDLLLYGEQVLDLPASENDPARMVPHPRMLERVFVLEPLVELAPETVHPVSGRTIAAHLADLRDVRTVDWRAPGLST